MDVVHGTLALDGSLGRLYVVVGVFDGLHRGHLYLLENLVAEARRHGARPAVITFDHHPDEILVGAAPPLLLDPEERLERLAEAGVDVTVVETFDLATRMTPYDTWLRRITERVALAGLLMTPESAFGYERGGTPETVTALGRELGYGVSVVRALEIDGRPVRSGDIRAAISAGDLERAAALLGRPVTVTGDVRSEPAGRLRIGFDLPMALPPEGRYRALLSPPTTSEGPPEGTTAMTAVVTHGELLIEGATAAAAGERRRVEFLAPAGGASA
jgi:riboflavin kinase/FMN adenylyltransferase